ncbi:tetratricopeptide repeat protein 5-like [Cimex lectularius]|uniref:Tetratricopeptide repeat protein 5 OB fold domain-containing protein n=1 Tax=Cimex lectularius TaxID=79782 RepID=A0A8I6RUR8_CIMLE|nr:tetratricopeptide repeat protein 5-like [Cimex lectularius]
MSRKVEKPVGVCVLYGYLKRFKHENALLNKDPTKFDVKVQEAEAILENLNFQFEQHVVLSKMYSLSLNHLDKAVNHALECVKFHPELYELWNHLGELYYTQGRFPQAEKCFSLAMEKKCNPYSLRNLSMVMKVCKPSDDVEKYTGRILKSIEYASQSLELDDSDPDTYNLIGTAFLAAYFIPPKDPLYLCKAYAAFKNGENCPLGNLNCLIPYNKHVLFKYLHLYTEALQMLDQAQKLSPSWALPAKDKKSIISFLEKIHDSYVTNTKSKDLLQIKKKLSKQKFLQNKFSNKVQGVEGLDIGRNPDCCVVGRVIWNIPSTQSFPSVLGLCDNTGQRVIVLSIVPYLEKSVGLYNTLTINKPYLKEIAFTIDGKSHKFPLITVFKAENVLIGGKPLKYTGNVDTKFNCHEYLQLKTL